MKSQLSNDDWVGKGLTVVPTTPLDCHLVSGPSFFSDVPFITIARLIGGQIWTTVPTGIHNVSSMEDRFVFREPFTRRKLVWSSSELTTDMKTSIPELIQSFIDIRDDYILAGDAEQANRASKVIAELKKIKLPKNEETKV